jgi:uncharacterized protein (TIGR02266 family)
MPSRSNAARRLETEQQPISRPIALVGHRAAPRPTLEVELTSDSDSHFFAGLAGDVSRGGLFVATYRALALGSAVDVKLVLPDGDLDASGVVRWRRSAEPDLAPGVGIALAALSESDRARIAAFCRSRAPLYVDMDE